MRIFNYILALLLLPFLACAADFLWQVSVDEAVTDDNITLEFGCGAAEQRLYPVLPGVFGGSECYLVNPANVGTESAVATGADSRLSADIRPSGSRTPLWVIAVNNDMTLHFRGTAGAKLYFFRERVKRSGDKVSYSGEVGDSMYLRGGTLLALSPDAISAMPTVAHSADLRENFICGDDAENLLGRLPEESAPYLAAGTSAKVRFAAGTSRVAVRVAGDLFLEEGVTAEECGWLCTILLPEGAQLAGTPSYRAGVFTFAADRAGKISLSMQPQKSGIAGIATAFVDNTGKPSISNWILPAFGTLDFDDNGSVEIADALYLYNYVNSGLPLKGARWFSEAHLGQHTTATRRQLGNAMNTLQEMRSDLDYDASGTVDNDDAVYVYNFIAAGCPAEDSPEFSAESLKKNTSGAGGRNLQETLDRLRELSND